MKKKDYFIYILECSNGAYYTGYTGDIKKRYADHLSGKASKYTRSFKPLRIAACWKVKSTRGDALKIEAMIKRLTKSKKTELVLSAKKKNDLIFRKLEIVLPVKRLNMKELYCV
ncbi:MAG: GIY-YIG nuclease family protein [Spirochaetes bacterium]|jgi:putative endonuclease|nr:GIY-YIG nuclease family protein [Spirochaetota bacterium]